MTAPKFDWNLEIFDTWSDMVIDLGTLDAEDAPKMLVPLSLLPIGAVSETDDSWQDNYNKESTFPTIILEVCSDGELAIIDGNHRVIMWRKWGFTRVPALVTHAEMLDWRLPAVNGKDGIQPDPTPPETPLPKHKRKRLEKAVTA